MHPSFCQLFPLWLFSKWSMTSGWLSQTRTPHIMLTSLHDHYSWIDYVIVSPWCNKVVKYTSSPELISKISNMSFWIVWLYYLLRIDGLMVNSSILTKTLHIKTCWYLITTGDLYWKSISHVGGSHLISLQILSCTWLQWVSVSHFTIK